MTGKQPPGLFITGTSTGVGKTWVAACIARRLVVEGRRVGVYKPAASGCRDHPGNATIRGEPRLISDDAEMLWDAAGRTGQLEAVCPQRFRAPLAPHLAARAEGRAVDSRLLRSGIRYWEDRSDLVIVEGAGGLLSPLSDGEYVADLAHEFNYPLVIVATNCLGVINQVLQTLWTAATYRGGIPVAGIVLNSSQPLTSGEDPSTPTNQDEIVGRSPVPLLATLDWQAQQFVPDVPWFELAGQLETARQHTREMAQQFAAPR